MPRHARKKASTNIYHIVIRGADHQIIFENHNDYAKYLDLLEYYKKECQFELYAYCLMSNHIHLIIFTPVTPLETVFRRLNTAYAVWFNMKYNRTGFLQQGRYYSEPIEESEYLLTCARYIHQNPLKAGLEKNPGDSYLWSSFHDYKSTNSTLTDTAFLLSLAGSKENFLSFHSQESSEPVLDIQSLRTRLPDDVAREIIFAECGCRSVSDFQKISKLKQTQYLLLLHQKGLSIRQLNRLTGIPKGVIDRTMTKGHSS